MKHSKVIDNAEFFIRDGFAVLRELPAGAGSTERHFQNILLFKSPEESMVEMTAEEVQWGCTFDSIEDPKELAHIEPKYIKTSWLCKRPYVPAHSWYRKIKTVAVKLEIKGAFILEELPK